MKKKVSNKDKTKKTSNIRSNSPNIWLYLIPILILTFLFFIKTRNHSFVNWDDNDMLTENMQVRDLSAQGIIDIFTPSADLNEYQPLTTISYAFVYNFAGLTPWPYFVLTLLIHLMNIFLVFYLISILCNNKLLSSFVALLFALHPLQVEVVAWISAHNYVLFSFFFLYALIFYILYINHNYNKRFLIISLLFFIPALLAKSSAVVLPVVLFSFDYFYKRRLNTRLLLEKIPYVLLALVFGLIALIPKAGNQTVIMLTEHFNFIDRIFFFFYALSFYFIKIIVPIGLKVIHMYPEKINGFLPPIFYLSPLLAAIIVILVKYLKYKKREIIFGLLFFFSNLILITHIIPFFHISIVSERYTYLAGIGLFFIMGHGVIYIINCLPKWKIAFLPILSVYLVFLLVTTYNRIDVWKNSLTLWTQEVNASPQNAIAYNNRGEVVFKKGQYKKALADCNKAIEINNSFAKAFNNRGIIKDELGQDKSAIKDFNKAININPEFADAYYNKAKVKQELGDTFEALELYNKTVEISPNYYEAFYNRGNLKGSMGRTADAEKDFTRAIKINPGYAEAFNNRGITYAIREEYDRAEYDFKQAIKFDNQYIDAYINLSIMLLNNNRKKEACKKLKTAQNIGSQKASEMYTVYCQ